MAITSYMLATSMLLCSLVVAIATAGGEYEYNPASEFTHEYVQSASQKVEDKSEKVKGTTPGVFEKPTQYDLEKQTDKPKVEELKPEKKVNFPVSYDPTKTTLFRKQFRADCEGLVLCKSGQKFFPIKGAKAIITCKTVNRFGYEAIPSSTYTSETNEKGYFLMPLPQLKFVSNCKVEIKHSASEKCRIPINGKKWKNSSTYLSSYRFLNDRKVKLYSLQPSVYTKEEHTQTPTPTGY